MNYQEFRCEFLERMKEVMEEGVSITTEKINKNNGVVMEGLVLKSENARVASIFYMEDYFSYWERGVPLEQLVRKVMWQFEHCKPQMDVEADFFQNYQEIKENICFKLINYERNRELLKKPILMHMHKDGIKSRVTTLIHRPLTRSASPSI